MIGYLTTEQQEEQIKRLININNKKERGTIGHSLFNWWCNSYLRPNERMDENDYYELYKSRVLTYIFLKNGDVEFDNKTLEEDKAQYRALREQGVKYTPLIDRIERAKKIREEDKSKITGTFQNMKNKIKAAFRKMWNSITQKKLPEGRMNNRNEKRQKKYKRKEN